MHIYCSLRLNWNEFQQLVSAVIQGRPSCHQMKKNWMLRWTWRPRKKFSLVYFGFFFWITSFLLNTTLFFHICCSPKPVRFCIVALYKLGLCTVLSDRSFGRSVWYYTCLEFHICHVSSFILFRQHMKWDKQFWSQTEWLREIIVCMKWKEKKLFNQVCQNSVKNKDFCSS